MAGLGPSGLCAAPDAALRSAVIRALMRSPVAEHAQTARRVLAFTHERALLRRNTARVTSGTS